MLDTSQEPVTLNKWKSKNGMVYLARCPKCKALLDSYYNPHYCGDCGQAVRWDD